MSLTTTVRSAPVGVKLGDGYQTLIAFDADPDVSFWEKTVQPPGADGGPPVDITTMHNVTYEQQASQALKKMTDGTMKVAYDPLVLDQIIALVNVEGPITCKFPNDDTWDYYGFLQKFIPDPLVRGQQPEATITVCCTCTDPDTGAEVGPNYKTSSGTD